MLSVVERMGLLDEVEVLSSQRDYVALDELLSSSDPIIVASDPILRYYRTLAKLQIGEMTEAFDFGYNDIQFFARHHDARVYRR